MTPNSENVIDSLFVSLGMSLDDKGFKKAQDQVKGLKDGLIQLGAIAGASVGLDSFTRGIANKVNELQRLSNITRFTSKEIEGLNHALRNVGVFSDNAGGDIAQRIEQMQRAIRSGESNAKTYFTGDTFDPMYFASLDGAKALEYLMKSYSARDHLGQSWMREGLGVGVNDSLTRLIEMAPEKYRGVMDGFNNNYSPISDSLIESSERFNAELADLKLNFDNLQKTMGEKLLPIVNSLLGSINSFAEEHPDLVSAGVIAGGALGAAGALSVLRGGAKSLLGLVSVGGRMIPVVGAASAGYYGGGWLGDGLNNLFGDNDYFQRIRSASTWGDFGAALLGEGDARWDNGRWVDNRGTGNESTSNMRRYLDRLAVAEGTSDKPNSGYSTLFGGGQFADFSDHPRQYFNHNGTRTSAAGRYQITAASWDDAKKALGLKDFSPANQDLAAMWLAKRAGQLDNINLGNFNAADQGLDRVWTGLQQYTRGNKTFGQSPLPRSINRKYSSPLDSYSAPGAKSGSGPEKAIIQNNNVVINAGNANPEQTVSLLMTELSNRSNQAITQLSTDKY
ncbi:TPA: glycoside hydrolase family 104 protein [Enterobacter sichuanensis]|nr:glycoside hydrolase family 104 protein [Enterobacter sichuanensis]